MGFGNVECDPGHIPTVTRVRPPIRFGAYPIRMRNSRRLAAAFLLTASAVGTATAYEDDTHYVYTYLAARAVGFTPEQARRIGSATLSVDHSDATEPVQGAYLIPTQKSFYARTAFHAFSNTGDGSDVQRQLAFLFDAAQPQYNPGVFMHAYQDSYSHAGYYPDYGHWSPNPFNGLPIGHFTDYLSMTRGIQGGRDDRMAYGTAHQLAEYMRAMGVLTDQRPREGFESDVPTLRDTIVNANPSPSRWSSPSSTAAVKAANAILKKREGFLPSNYAYDYALSSEFGAVVTGSNALRFPIWLKGTFRLDFTPNRAGITPGPVRIVSTIYDPWASADVDGHVPYLDLSLPEGGESAERLMPVGGLRARFMAKGVDVSKLFALNTGRADLVLPVRFDRFSIAQRNSVKSSGGNATISGLGASSNVAKDFPKGNVVALVSVADANGKKTLLYFGGMNTYGGACSMSKLGWNGFSATGCSVEIGQGSFFKGSMQMAMDDKGAGSLSFNVPARDWKGNSVVYSGTISLPAADLRTATVPSYVR